MRTWLIALAAGFAILAVQIAHAATPAGPPVSTPAGVTFADVTGSDSRFLWRYFTTIDGKPLYTFDADGSSGKSTCAEDCARDFSPYLASANTAVGGEWSLIPAGAKL